MQSIFLSPNGQLNSPQFIRAGYILILMGIGLSVLRLMLPSIAAVFSTASLFLIYPWINVWLKRLRHGGKDRAYVFLYIFAYGVFVILSFTAVLLIFGGPEFFDIINAKAVGDISHSEYLERAEALGPDLALPALIAGVLSSWLTLYIGDKTIP